MSRPNFTLKPVKLFAKIIKETSTLMITTDVSATYAELNSQFTSGINFPKPKTTNIRASVHHVPTDIQLNDPEVFAELESQGITTATRRFNKASKEATE